MPLLLDGQPFEPVSPFPGIDVDIELLRIPVVRRLQADHTISNSEVGENAVDLVFPVLANERYAFEFVPQYDSTAVADIRFGFTLPAAATISWAPTGNNDLSTTTIALAASGNARKGTIEGIITIGATPGTAQLIFAQDTAEVSNTILQANSIMTVIRLP